MIEPNGDTYTKIIKTRRNEIYIDGFVLFNDGTIKYRQCWKLEPKEATKWIEAIQQQSNELSKEQFEKAEHEYLRREKEETRQWIESDVFRKYFGIDIVGRKEKSIMRKVEKALKEEHKLKKKK